MTKQSVPPKRQRTDARRVQSFFLIKRPTPFIIIWALQPLLETITVIPEIALAKIPKMHH